MPLGRLQKNLIWIPLNDLVFKRSTYDQSFFTLKRIFKQNGIISFFCVLPNSLSSSSIQLMFLHQKEGKTITKK